MSEYILEMKHIVKVFPGVKALNDVNLKVKKGEIHCLVGENGAGKSTLMKILSGVWAHGSYSGDIIFKGEVQSFKNIADSEKKGIAIIYQELALFPELTLYENIYFGHEIVKGKVIDWNETILQTKKMLEKVDLNLDPSLKLKHLGVGQQQLVEIAKALSKNVQLLILDEPTSALNDEDSEHLLQLIKELKKQGVTCIMISHKLKEVIAIADAITILRDGQTISTIDRDSGDINEQFIIKNMVGREINDIFPKRSGVIKDEVILKVKNWTVEDPVKHRVILHDINIEVKKGEIVGIQGMMGAGRTEFALSLFGNSPHYKILSGEVFLAGERQHWKNPKNAIQAGLAYVSEDRKKNGLILIQDIRYNITIANLKALAKGLTINENKEIKVAQEYKDSIGIKAPSINQITFNLSGGNQQKVQLAKWLFVEPSVLILDEPTRGIDVGAKQEIYTLMNRLVEKGMSIIMISSELLEVIGMSDRIYIMSEGRISGEVSASEATEEKIMALSLKQHKEKKYEKA